MLEYCVQTEHTLEWKVHKLAQKTDDNTSKTKSNTLLGEHKRNRETEAVFVWVCVCVRVSCRQVNEYCSAFVHRILEFIVVLDNAKFSFDTIYSLLLKFDTLSVFS